MCYRQTACIVLMLVALPGGCALRRDEGRGGP